MASQADPREKKQVSPATASGNTEAGLVSVVIPVYNSEKTLRQCLESVLGQTHKQCEIVVVDSHSVDRTANIAREYNGRLYQLDGTPNLKRSYGLGQARGEYVLYLDSDMVLTPTVVEDCVACLAGGKADALEIKEVSVARGFWAKCLVPTRGAFAQAGIILPRFFHRRVLEAVPVDEEILFGDDYAHSIEMTKAGFRLAQTDAVVEHNEHTSLKGMYRRYHEAFKSSPRFTKKHGLKPLAPYASANIGATFKKWILTGLFLRDPHHFAGMLVIKVVRLSGAVTGTVAGLLGSSFKSH